MKKTAMSSILQYNMAFHQYILWSHTFPENWQITSYPFDSSFGMAAENTTDH
jgi:hypothetical protein